MFALSPSELLSHSIFVLCTSFTQLSCNSSYVHSVFHARMVLTLPCFSNPPLPSIAFCVCCPNYAVILFPLLVTVARAEECIWRSYPSCPRATWDAEKEEMLYILNSATTPISSLIAIIHCIFQSFTLSLSFPPWHVLLLKYRPTSIWSKSK